MKQLKLLTAALLIMSPFAANATVISMTETFDEYGSQTTPQFDFEWTFTGLAEAIGDLTITFDWERMDFENSFEWMDTLVEGTLLGRLGDANSACDVAGTPSGGSFNADCSGSATFVIAAAQLLSDGILSLTSLSNNVHSNGQDFGFISATLSYEIADEIASVPEPATLALLGLGLAGMGMTRRRKKA